MRFFLPLRTRFPHLPTLGLLALSAWSTSVAAPLKAFPSAEGFGMYAAGGRGGDVYRVTTLADTGKGSFRDAVSQPNRTVVFAVGGVIELQKGLMMKPGLTIAGQTAPGGGITVYGAGINYGNAHGTITRHIRYRMGTRLKVGQLPPTDSAALAAYNDDGSDAVTITTGTRMIFDHVSVSWGRDGTFDINTNFTARVIDSITIQNSIISQGLMGHSTGGLLQTKGSVSVLRTLYANNWTRNPKVSANLQYVNNVLYNWGASSLNFGGYDMPTRSHVTGNYFINGPGGTRPGIMGGDSFVTAYIKGNYWDVNRNGVLDGRDTSTQSDSVKLVTQPFAFPPLANEFTAPNAYAQVLAKAGASLRRDAVDSLVIAEVKSLGKVGVFIRTEDTLVTRGPGKIAGGIAPADSESDGMSDVWELAHGLNPKDAKDGKAVYLSSEGYTNLEMYLNELAGDSVVYAKRAPVVTISVVKTDSLVPVDLTLNASVHDSDGTIAQVSLWVDGKEVNVLKAAPWTFSVREMTAGKRSYQIKATDNAGNVGSATATVALVADSTPPPVSLSVRQELRAGAGWVLVQGGKSLRAGEVQIVDPSGAIVRRMAIPAVRANRQSVEIPNYAELLPGAYVVRIKNGSAPQVQSRFVKP